MSQREALLLMLIIAAAFAAAFSFRVVAHPGEIHDPDFARAFEEAEKVLPLLGAVRVRTGPSFEDPQPPEEIAREREAAHRLRTSTRGGIVRVSEPARAVREFRYGRLLYGTKEDVRAVRDALRRKAFPRPLPEMPRLDRVFVDRWGPYACDVIVDGPAGVESIRAELPEAVISGEPVIRAREVEETRDVPRALIVAVVLVYAWCRLRRLDAERRLLAATLAVAVLGVLGWGVDVTTVFAIAIAAGSASGPMMGCGALLLFFPAMALKRMGLVFLVAAVARWRTSPPPLPAPRRVAARVLVVLCVLSAVLFWSLPAWIFHKNRFEPSATFVDRDDVGARAKELRESGLHIVGDEDPVPPAADLETRRMLNEIHQRASNLVRIDQRFAEWRDAAAVDSLYWPAELRARLRTTDGRAVLWTQNNIMRRHEFNGSLLYRWRGKLALTRDAKIAAVLLLIAIGAADVIRHGAVVPVLVRFAVVWGAAVTTLGFAIIWPLLVMASAARSLAVVWAVAGAAGAMSFRDATWFPLAVFVAAVALVSWAVSRPRPHPGSSPPDQTGPDRLAP